MAGKGNDHAPDGGARDESFLARWSRRKQAAENGPTIQSDVDEDVEPPAVADAEASVAAADEADAGADEEALPHPDTLDADSDFSAYLTGRVSSAFRRAAMRRLFSQPEFNLKDGLDDYDDDYTQFRSLGETVTAHMRHRAERQREREHERAAEGREAAPAEDDAHAPPAGDDDGRRAPADAPERSQAGDRRGGDGDDDDAG